jgi:hypothetical protein
MEDDTLVKKAYLENVASNSDWCQTIQILNSSQDLHSGNIEEAQFAMVAKKRLRENFIKYWRNRIDDRTREKKLHIYSEVKQEYKMEEYLDLPKFRDRQRISKFITSNHCLEIEKGRHNNKTRAERLCRACDLGIIEDEEHFLLNCTAYDSIRPPCLTNPPTGTDDNRVGQFFQTNSPPDITNYLKRSFAARDKLVNFHVTQMSLCGMRMTIGRGADKKTTKLSTKLQATALDNHKIKISRRNNRLNPYSQPNLNTGQ